MIAAPFDYVRARTLEEAIALLTEHGDDAKLLAGGHSLLPAMKLRVARPKLLIDIAAIDSLRDIREEHGFIAIGAAVTHSEIHSSDLVRRRCPLLAEVAPLIADLQVRNKGTLGGNLAHGDPAADWPAAILALEAELTVAGPDRRRTVPAGDFFVDLFQTNLEASEILCEIRVPVTPPSVAYVKSEHPASGFAISGVAVVLDEQRRTARVGVTGAAPRPYRAFAVEGSIKANGLSPSAIAAAAALAVEDVEPNDDDQISAEFRAHLTRLNTRRALQKALTR